MNNTLPQPRFLWFLILSYTMIMVFANWFDARLVRIFNIDTDAGTIIFPLTFLLSNLITEVYGYRHARLAIWCGFLFNILFILYGQLIIHLPSPDYAVINNAKFSDVLSLNSRVITASIISYLCAEPLNSFIMAKLKIAYAGKQLALRFVASTFIASGVDSFIFGTIAFAGLMSYYSLVFLMMDMWFLKIVIEVIGLPISIYLANKLKRLEKLDIYDKRTNFNLFSLRTDYTEKDNYFD